MAIIKDFIEATRARRQPVYPEVALRAGGAEQDMMPDFSLAQYQGDLYRCLSWVQTAVMTVAESCATQSLSVKQLAGETEIDMDNHPFELLMRRPNPDMSRFAFLAATFSYRLLTGNAYWWLNKPGQYAPPDEIWLIPSSQIRPIPDKRLYIAGYEYDPGDSAKTMTLPPDSIVHFKAFNPASWQIGLSPVEAIAVSADSDLAMQRWNKNYFAKNNAKSPGILTFADQIPDGDWARMQSEFKHEYGGTERQLMMLRGTGQGGVQWVQTAMTQRDMEFLAGRQFAKEEIYSIFGKGLAAILDKNTTEANALAAKEVFSEFTLWPLLSSVAEVITNKIMPLYGQNLIAEFDDPRKTDRVLELQEQQEYAKYHTVNEIRTEKYGNDPLPPDDPRGEMFVAEITPGVSHSKDEQKAKQEMQKEMQERLANGLQQENPQGRQEEVTTEDEEPAKTKALKGGPGSGNFGHAGRPGERGGSIPRSGGAGGAAAPANPDDFKVCGTVAAVRPVSSTYRDWAFNAVDDVEASALSDYKNYEYYSINTLLRAGVETDTTRLIDKALAKAPPIPQNVRLYRGVPENVVSGLKVGDIWMNKGYTSTTLDPHGTSSFGSTRIEILARAGSRGVFMDFFGTTEWEMLLPSNSRFRVLSKSDHSVRMEYLDD